MNTRHLSYLSLAAAALLAIAVPVAVSAQSAPSAPAAPPAPRPPFLEMACSNTDARLTAGLSIAEIRLRITDAQRAAFDKFAAAARASIAPFKTACANLPAGAPPTSLPDRMSRDVPLMAAGVQALQAMQPAVAELYAQLTPDQQQTADRLMEGHGFHHGPEHGHMPWRHERG